MESPKTSIIDIDAFDTLPKRKVKIDGVDYPAFSIVDVPYSDYLKATRLEEHMKAIPDEKDQIAFVADLVQAFVPSLPREVLLGGNGRRGMSMRKIGLVVGLLCLPDASDLEAASDPLEKTPDA